MRIEQGGNEMAEIAELISTAVLRRHLETMDRLDIEYDFLPRESEILHLHFWDVAFQQLKEKGVLYFETEGKNKGCWVMTRPEEVVSRLQRQQKALKWGTRLQKDLRHDTHGDCELRRPAPTKTPRSSCAPTAPSAMSAKTSRITLEVWPAGARLWLSQVLPLSQRSRSLDLRRSTGETDHPHFGSVAAIYNVIDSRQSDPQNTVIEALRLAGLHRAGRALHAFLLRDGGAHAALRAGAWLRGEGRRSRQVLH